MTIRRVAVIGAGTMGSGIAQVCAQTGWETSLFDAFSESLERGVENIEKFWEKGISKGKTTSRQKEEWSANLIATREMSEAVRDSDIVIEAVPEKMELKRSIFEELEGLAPPNAILATNTSGLPISEIAAHTSCPERVIGMHFFNPVPLMQLLEIVRHEAVDERTVSVAKEVGEAMGKTTILVSDVPGFATSRLGVVLGNEAIRMLAEGVASASDIDTAMRLGYRHPMGPLELSDLVGLDVRMDILNSLAEAFQDDSYRPHPLLKSLVESGNLGKKSGRGIYDWTSGDKVERV
ncbi:MAG: 3-hydroxyacyl-CoA dehydrogenase family protein [Candidatus Thalassarchaeaceae archaeon]|nr:3-hydroxyacyl-CoA dehydrogenase family protein [Candidatus Thalassarchaeaceae archaeon]